MNKTKIDWCDSTWNPVTGCLHGCEYCYARGIASRFSTCWYKMTDDKVVVLDEKIYGEEDEKALPYPYGFKPTLYRYRLNEYQNKKSRNIFVCSMADLFGKWVPDGWKIEVLEACRKADIPLFMKSSLADIWGEPLIQEFPEEWRKESCKK